MADKEIKIEIDYNFELMDIETANKLTEGLGKSVNVTKDRVWNNKLISSELMQGIMSGESIDKIAGRLKNVESRMAKTSVLNARTMTTSIENAGRQESYVKAQENGIIMKKVWMSTPDERTRDSHLELEGEEVDVNDKFSNGLMYPADPSGEPSEVYNCRCTMFTKIIGFKKVYNDEKSFDGINGDSYRKNEMIKPIRPKKKDYEYYDDYLIAKEEYKKNKEEWSERVDSVIEKIVKDTEPMSIEELKEWCKNNNVNIGEGAELIDEKLLRITIERTEDFIKDYPQVFKMYEAFGKDINGNDIRYEIGLERDRIFQAEANNGIHFGEIGMNIKDAIRSSFEAQDGISFVTGAGGIVSTIDHEFGHNIWQCIKWNYYDVSSELEREFIESVYGKEGMSEYATTNVSELFAEAFSSWYGGDKTEFAIATGEFIKMHPLTYNFDKISDIIKTI